MACVIMCAHGTLSDMVRVSPLLSAAFVQTYTYGIVRATITEYFTSGVAEAINAAGVSYAVVINARATRQLLACDV